MLTLFYRQTLDVLLCSLDFYKPCEAFRFKFKTKQKTLEFKTRKLFFLYSVQITDGSSLAVYLNMVVSASKMQEQRKRKKYFLRNISIYIILSETQKKTRANVLTESFIKY